MGGGGVCGRGVGVGAFCWVCIYHNQKMHVYLIIQMILGIFNKWLKPRQILTCLIKHLLLTKRQMIVYMSCGRLCRITA